ncbi:acetate/propionate family kinase [Weissella sagaensis]|jgi:acetate kinase|uniref:Acetate kinase n=1 Tax=Weissella sagaensis TaxID=2559928 RepID=A0ABW1RSY7_9LACO|nr:acetate kinase [Weissella sagaensis]KAA8432861.1 acetate kinase [Weissella paramesenteroides]MBU7568318.1 acetate kinase [Weissella hellenica]KAA8437965.1 acetate kinase [Weissella paramesenteroides]QDJ59148.1 acetate kinase [Weissella hellenica]QEA56439.1 acetate kinase [Weissella hellenica]
MAKTMAINAGSSSLKFQLFEMPAETVIAKGQVERIGMNDSIFTLKYNGEKFEVVQDIADHEAAINLLLAQLKEHEVIADFSEITGVGHRIVAGGEWFNKSVVVDDEVLNKIERLADYAPLHNASEALGIRVFQKLLPNALSVAVFDTAFHQSMPKKNYLYALPYEYYTKYGARKYGAHGTSHKYVAQRTADILGKKLEDLKIITLHLGAGASITAIKDGKSFDTSMGFTPLAGVAMATRTGDVDPSLVYYIQNREGLSNDEMLNILNKKSGLLGVSSLSSDMRDLEEVEDTNDHAALAIEMFIDRVVRYVGQYYVELGGVDALTFTAGIGENAANVREAIIDRLAFMGIKLDAEKNELRDDEVIISSEDSTAKVLKVATNEELMIARDVQTLQAN